MAQTGGPPPVVKPSPTRPGPITAANFSSANGDEGEGHANGASPVRAQSKPGPRIASIAASASSPKESDNSSVAQPQGSPSNGMPTQQSNSAPTTGAGGADALDSSTNSNVINVFDEEPPSAVRPAAPHLNGVQALVLAGCLAFAVIFPVLFGGDGRLVDSLALLTFLPAGIAFAYAFSATSRRVVAPINLWGKFAFGWLALLPTVLVTSTILIALGTVGLSLLSHITQNLMVFLVGWTVMMTFCVVAVEETGKYLVTLKKDSFSNVENPRQFVLYSLFTALGLATGESYYLVLFIRHLLDALARFEAGNAYSFSGSFGGQDYFSHQSSYVHSEGGDFADRGRTFSVAEVVQLISPLGVIWILVCCIVIIVPMHVLSGYHVGLGIAYREVMKTRSSPIRSLVLPFIFRFVFLFIILWLPVFAEIDFLGLAALPLVPIYIYVVRRDELRMPRTYLNRAGYMNAFGYGVLGDNDDSEAPDLQLESQNQALPAVTTQNQNGDASPHVA